MAFPGLDREQLNDLWDRLNRLEVANNLGGTRDYVPVQTSTRLKEALTREFQEYKLPRYTRAAYAEMALLKAKRKLAQAKELESHRRLMNDPTSTADVEYWKQNRSWTVAMDGAVYPYDFEEEKFDTTEPLAFDGEVKLSEFKDSIEYFVDSQTMSLPGTLRSLKSEAERRGFDYTAFGKLLHQFIMEHYPAQKIASFHCIKNNDTPGLWQLLVELISPEAEKSKIRAARASIVRKPSDNISTVMHKIRSLAYQEIGVTNPGISRETLDTKSYKLAQHNLKDFISEECWSHYEAWVYQRLTMNLETSFTDAIRKVESLEEENPSLKPTTTLHIKEKQIDPQSLSWQVNFARTGSSSFSTRRPRGDRSGKSAGFQSTNKSRSVSPAGSRGRSTSNDSRKEYKDNYRNNRRPFSGRESRSPSKFASQSPDRSNRRNRYQGGNGSRDRRDKAGFRSPRFSSSRDRRDRGERKDNRYGGRQSGSDRPRDRSWSSGARNTNRGFSGRNRFGSGRDERRSSRDRSNSRDLYDDPCVRCNSRRHRASSCPRYDRSDHVCKLCSKRGLRLYHEDSECRFSKSSDYRTPSPRRKVNNVMTRGEDEYYNYSNPKNE